MCEECSNEQGLINSEILGVVDVPKRCEDISLLL